MMQLAKVWVEVWPGRIWLGRTGMFGVWASRKGRSSSTVSALAGSAGAVIKKQNKMARQCT